MLRLEVFAVLLRVADCATMPKVKLWELYRQKAFAGHLAP